MEVREAVEADAERMADIAGSPADVMRNLIHDRTVRVACVEDEGETDEDDDAETNAENAEAGGGRSEEAPDAREDESIVALVSFDALEDTVHVTQLAGPSAACQRLLEEPVGFAESENMSVELLVPSGEDDVESAAQAAGFDSTGTGPAFEGRTTTRYRLEPGTPQH